MQERIKKLMGAIDALSLRERLFVFAAVLAVVGGVWEALLAAPLEARERLAAAKIDAGRGRIEQLNKSVTLAAEGISNGMPGHIDRLEALRQRVAAGEESLRIFTSDLVDPAQMRLVLEDLLDRQRGLTLVSVANLEVRPVVGDAGDDELKATGGPTLYRHGLALVLEGSYLDLFEYLEAVERLPWQLYWGRLSLETASYPRARIVIELKTLSLDEDWIGV